MLSCGGKKEESNTDVIRVETENVGSSQMDGRRSYVGEVEAETSTVVSFTGMGTVLRMYVNEGQHVTKGQLIAQMDPTQNKNALMAAEAMLTQAQDAYDRMKVLHDQHSISDMDWMEMQSKLQQAKSSYQMAKKSVTDCNLKAPCSGVVGNKMIEAGMTAMPAQPVCNILNVNRVKVKVSVPEKEVGSFTSSMLGSVSITVAALGGRTYTAQKIEKGVQADALSRTYDVRFTVANPDAELLPGMVAEVSCGSVKSGLTIGKSVATLPIRCVQQGADGRHFVWTVKNGKAHRQDVVTGDTDGNRIAVTSGVSEGDKVITAGYQKVSEGSRVK